MTMMRRNAMPRRQIAVMLLVLALAPSAAGQGRRAKADPISGTWSGQLIPADAPRGRSITLVLKYDGKSKVSGTIAGFSNPGDVKAGTYDAKTGALKLELGRADGAAVLLVLEGKVEKNVAAGRASGDVAGEFKIARKE
jgi:hypothetical protein